MTMLQVTPESAGVLPDDAREQRHVPAFWLSGQTVRVRGAARGLLPEDRCG